MKIATYPTRLQGIQRKSGQVQIYANIPLPLAAALDMEAGEMVQWKVLDRTQLVLVRASANKKIRVPGKESQAKRR